MNESRRIRAVALPAVTLAWPNLRRWTGRLLAFAFCLVSALLLTATRLEITRLGYRLSDLHREREEIAAQVSRLQVEAAALASPRRIEEEARKLGLTFPDRDRIVVLDE